MAEIRLIARMKCPKCGGEMEVWGREDRSFWPEGILELTMSCKCGYRGFDVLPLKIGEPSRLELRVENEDDLKIRLAKSSSGTVKIPELGVEIKPGPAAEGYISNVEGILDRVENVLVSMVKWKKPKASSALNRLRKIREELSEPFTLIIEDPTGCSLIVSEKTKKSRF